MQASGPLYGAEVYGYASCQPVGGPPPAGVVDYKQVRSVSLSQKPNILSALLLQCSQLG